MPFAAKEDPLFTRSRRWINNLPRHTSTISWLTSHRPPNSSADDTRYLCSFVNRAYVCICLYLRAGSTHGLLRSCRGYGKRCKGRLVNDACECGTRSKTVCREHSWDFSLSSGRLDISLLCTCYLFMVRFLADIWFDSSIDENEEEELRIGSIKCGVENFLQRVVSGKRIYIFIFIFLSNILGLSSTSVYTFK